MLGLRDALRTQMRETLSGQADGRPAWITDLQRGEDRGFFAPDSATWAVHRGAPTLVAGIRALLVQALHPGALAGVHDWSTYKEDPLGRLAGTIRWIFTVSYGDTRTAINGSNWVLKLHERVVGDYVDAAGRTQRYSANDPDLLRWVHLAFTDSFLATHLMWGGPIPGGADQYVREWAKAGELMGVPNPPRSQAELADQLADFDASGVLTGSDRVQEVVRFIRRPPLPTTQRLSYPILFNGAIASIPTRYRGYLDLSPKIGAVAGTRLVLRAAGSLLGEQTAGERWARRRLARLDAEDEVRDATSATPA